MNEEIARKIATLEAQRALLGDAVVEAALAALRQEAVLAESTEIAPVAVTVGESRALAQMAARYRPPDPAYEAALRLYLEHLLTTHHALNLRGIRTERVVSLELEQVYVTLSTANPEQAQRMTDSDTQKKQTRPIPELLTRHKRLVVLGTPGCGKTTLLSYLALTCARAALADQPDLLAERLGLDAAALPLPIFLPLREFAAFVRQASAQGRIGGGAPTLLLDYLQSYFQRWQLTLPPDFFRQMLTGGHCLVLLDGLDEVADYDERVVVSEHVSEFVRRFSRNRFVLSSRQRGYVGAAQLGEGFFPCTVLDFNDEEIEQFVANWTLAVEVALAGGVVNNSVRAQAARQTAELQQAVLGNARVRALAVNPLLLTVIALVHQYRARLPENRAELYNECTEVLLGSWETGKPGEEGKRLAYFTGTERTMDPAEKRAFIEPIAFAMQEQGVREWDKQDLLAHLREQFVERGETAAQAEQMARKFLEALALRSGLLREVEVGVYQFLHLTFQEYLAARYLADRDDFTTYAAARVMDTWWKETILLAASHLGSMGRRRVALLLQALQKSPLDAEAGLLLAGECLVDLGDGKVEAGVQQEIRQGLLALLEPEGGATNPQRRVSAGLTLGRLGDPRDGVETLPPLLTAPIAGDFLFGEENEPRQSHPFRAGVYPVTNAQYGLFMADGGYDNRAWWSEAGWRWRQGKPFWRWHQMDRPDFWLDRRFNGPNQPVVGVTWYEAEAFCAWLTARYERAYRLPTEEEWEHLARGAQGRVYPWGNDWRDGLANTKELGVGQTSAVGSFPAASASPLGVYDCAGNVWEWCADGRLLKGGSWIFDKDPARCWARLDFYPDNSNDHYGFRVVAPIS